MDLAHSVDPLRTSGSFWPQADTGALRNFRKLSKPY